MTNILQPFSAFYHITRLCRSSAILACLCVILALLPTPARGQAEEADTDDERTAEVRGGSEGPWFSDRVIELFIMRWADEAGSQFGLDDRQQQELRDKMLNRWPAYLEANRTKILPVFNEFVEMRLEMEPPDKERVSQWAEKAEELVKDIREEFNRSNNDMRSLLNPLQRARFEVEALKFGVGFQMAEAKMKEWKTGKYEEREFWDPPASVRRQRRNKEKADKGETTAEKDKIEKELDGWREYVQEIVELYAFDDGQRGTAKSILEELSSRAISHRDRYRMDMQKLEKQIAQQSDEKSDDKQTKEDSKQAQEDIKAKIVELYGPIDTYFKELQARVEALIRNEQKVMIEQMDAETLQKRRREARERSRAAARQQAPRDSVPAPVPPQTVDPDLEVEVDE